MTYLRDAWYAAALGQELSGGGTIGRVLLGDSLVLYRGASGDPIALLDRCPHRFAQLHLGEVLGDEIQCPYHGLRFDAQGFCTHNPQGGGAIPGRPLVRSYPTVERHGAIWIWMGSRDAADPSLIPDFAILDHPEPNARAADYMHLRANYELLTDNLMDLSHAEYVHIPPDFRDGAWSRLKAKVTCDERSVRSIWTHRTDRLPPFFRATLRDPDSVAEQVMDMTWLAPSNMLMRITVRDADSPPADDAEYAMAYLVTPETDTSCHMFVLTVRNWATDDAKLNENMIVSLMDGFRNEDRPVVESVQRSMGTAELWSLDPITFASDAGAVQARRMLQRLLSAEARKTAAP